MSEDDAAEPDEQDEDRAPKSGTALCLSGGGYRAMVFHLGALLRLNEAGLLPDIDCVSSVSGGSITAAALALAWPELRFDDDGVADNFIEEVVSPVRKVAARTIDSRSVVLGALLPGSASSRVTKRYEKLIFGDRTLQDLPADGEGPRFVINATNVQSGVLWRFSRPYMADYKVGRVDRPQVPLAVAVAASSAFPPVLSPAIVDVDPSSYTAESKNWELADLQAGGKVYLTDGGVYDNLGLETAKRYGRVLVSDGGGVLTTGERIARDWARHSVRVLQVIDSQVRSLRKRDLISAFVSGKRAGTFWGINTDIAGFQLDDALPCDPAKVESVATIATRLKRLRPRRQEGLINWGYAVCDAALRRWVDSSLPAPTDFPYPRSTLE